MPLVLLQVDEPMYFVDFLREPMVDDETGEVLDAHPSNYEAVPGGLPEIRARVEALQRRFNEESKVCLTTDCTWQTVAVHSHGCRPFVAYLCPVWY